MISAGLLFSASGIALKAFAQELPALEAAFFRNGVGFALVLLLSFTGIKRVKVGKRKGILFFRGLFGTLGLICFVWAVLHMDLGLATALNQASPIYVAVLAVIFLKERFHWQSYLFILLAFFGLTLIVSPDFSSINKEAFVALASGIFAGIAYIFVRVLRSTEAPETVVLWFLGMGTIIPLAFIFVEPWVMPDLKSFLGLIFVGVSGYLAQLALTNAYRYAPATIVSPFIYASTLSSLLIGYLFWGERPANMALLGCAIIIVSAIAISQIKAKPLRKSVPDHSLKQNVPDAS
jgi:drug/metabolite transporter (DMT)-like permease